MAPYFTNNSCNPFLEPTAPCTLGNLAVYAVNATCTEDIAKTMDFVRRHNIRLTIRNTGHDYMGKAAGAGSLTIWTHYLNGMEVLNYNSSFYTGKALKMGPGVMNQDAFRFTQSHGLVNVGSNCQTVGVAGGYTQGGGHGPLGSKFGLAADQALEWEVVTGTGEVLTARPDRNQDLYWALSGGGGGTYGVVTSLTVKTYPDLSTTASNLTFTSAGIDSAHYWDVVHTWIRSLPTLTGSGCWASWVLTPGVFTLGPGTCPGKDREFMSDLLQPTLSKLRQYNVSYNLSITEFPTFYDSYVEYNSPWNVSNAQLGGRLIPKSLIEDNSTALLDVLRTYTDDFGLVVSGVTLNVSQAELPPGGNAVTPVWRTAVFDAVLGTAYNYSDYHANTVLANDMTYKYLPMLERLTPGGGAYLNEADFQQPDYKEVFYGGNYDRLLKIKEKYDPNQIFYAITAVGSDRWYEDATRGGRLCRVH
ncbi:hypothetical protein PRZ48_014897 [Zasmidium cellare]|uniref:FAD-binding PCMH-type domain-containing protein n=1 Tax=Zasmidium cellare TaxID=395010 RepID=A0ABR0DX13_ZASCE|nr:hypothetical protein PRZ48_014897 [Zasmidium cellare]